jgi:hypothetical protein
MKHDPFWVPYNASDRQREQFWKKIGKAARKTGALLVGVKY